MNKPPPSHRPMHCSVRGQKKNTKKIMSATRANLIRNKLISWRRMQYLLFVLSWNAFFVYFILLIKFCNCFYAEVDWFTGSIADLFSSCKPERMPSICDWTAVFNLESTAA